MFTLTSASRSLLAKGSTLMQRLLIITLWKSKILDPRGSSIGTRAIFYRKLCWSFFWIYLGREPTQDDCERDIANAGGPLAGGWRGCIWALLQDLEALAEELQLKNYSQREPCNWCQANESSMHWNVLRPDARWLKSVWVGDRWLAKMRPTNEMFTLPGVTVTTAHPDHMHNKNLGSDGYVYASTIKYTIDYVLVGEIEQNEAEFMEHLQAAYEDAPPTYAPVFTITLRHHEQDNAIYTPCRCKFMNGSTYVLYKIAHWACTVPCTSYVHMHINLYLGLQDIVQFDVQNVHMCV